jgi:hypothetical protein
MRFLKDSYLTIFVAFFRFCQGNWSVESNMYKGVVGLCLFHCFILLGAIGWGAYFTRTRLPDIPRLTFYAVFFPFYLVHCYVLIRRRYGIAFERTFRAFERRRRTYLLTAAWLLMAASGAFVYGSAFYLRPYIGAHQ